MERYSTTSLWLMVKMAKSFLSLHSHPCNLQILPPKAKFIFLWSGTWVGHLTRLGQWDVGKDDINWGLKRSCFLKLALLLYLRPSCKWIQARLLENEKPYAGTWLNSLPTTGSWATESSTMRWVETRRASSDWENCPANPENHKLNTKVILNY